MSINFVKSGFWEHRNTILPLTILGVPLAIEAANIFVTLFTNPDCIKRKCAEIKAFAYNATHQRPEETRAQFHKRLAKNIALTVLALAAIACAAVSPFFVLPTALAIPAALAAIHAVALGIKFIYKAPELFGRIKNYLTDAFNKRDGEDLASFYVRRRQAIIRIAICSLLFAVTLTLACFATHVAIQAIRTGNFWSLYDFLPHQSKLVVFLEYLAVSLLHAAQAAFHWIKGNRERALFHLACFTAGIAFPITYLTQPEHTMRLHHSLIGLILQLAPWRSVRLFGSVVAFDSALYSLHGQRGFQSPSGFKSYDFMNTVVDNMSTVLTSLTALSLLETGMDFLLEKEGATKQQNTVTTK